MTLWFTADHHFGHANIIEYTNRPFDNVEQMDEALITAWNDVVEDGDLVYHLGDFTLSDWPFAKSVLQRLNGNFWFLYTP